jgi:excisionase family DNA binding protein
MDENVEFYTADEVASLLKLPLSTVYKLTQDAALPGFKVGKHWRFRKETIIQWTKNLEKEALKGSVFGEPRKDTQQQS